MASSGGELKVLFLDVGFGSSTLICLSTEGEAILVDCGHFRTTWDAIRAAGVSRLRLVLVTHSHSDHTRGIAKIIRNFPGPVDCVLYHPDGEHLAHPKHAYQSILRTVELKGILHTGPASSGYNALLRHLGVGVCRILHPTWEMVQRNMQPGGQPNPVSAVVLLGTTTRRVLLGGDLGAAGWSRLRDRGRLPQADVFLLPHHGGRFTQATYEDAGTEEAVRRPCITHEELLRRVQCTVIVISSGTARRENHPPHDEVLEAARDYCTATPGARMLCTEVTSSCDPGPLSHRHRALAKLPSACGTGRSASCTRSSPCAGTIIVHVGQGGELRVEPGSVPHGEVIAGYEHPRCRS